MIYYGEIKKRALQLLDQYSNGGALISESDPNSKDYLLKFPYLCDESQMEIATGPQPIPSVQRMKVGYEENLLNTVPGEETEYNADVPTETIIATVTGARSLYYEAIGGHTIDVEQESAPGSGVWVALTALVSIPAEFTWFSFPFTIPGADGINKVRLKLRGYTDLIIRNLAMYPRAYSQGTVPRFGTNIQIKLPDYFFRMDRLLHANSPIEYVQTSKTYIEIPSDKAGEIDMFYFVYPAPIAQFPAEVIDNIPLSVSDEAALAIPHYIAAKCMEPSPQFAQQAAQEMALYQNKLANLLPIKRWSSGNTMENTFFSNESNGFMRN